MDCGVYRITAPDDRIYVGSAARGFATRWRVHRHHLRRGTHHNKALQAIANKHGVDSLTFERVLVCAPTMATFYEQLVMDAFRPALNAAPVAGSSLGYRHTDETKAKFQSRKRGTLTEAGRLARAEANKQFRMSDEHRLAISKARGRRVECVELGRVFLSANSAAMWLRLNGKPKAKGANIGWAADGRMARAYGLSWRRA